MPRNRSTYVLTVREAAEVLSDLESAPVPPWLLRRLLADCVSRPSCRQKRGQTQLYRVEDLALARVMLRLKAAGVSAIVTRAIVSNHATAIIHGSRSRHQHVLLVHGTRGEVVRVESATPTTGTVRLPLQPVWTGLIEAVRAVRREWPTVPLWNRELPIEDAIMHNAGELQ